VTSGCSLYVRFVPQTLKAKRHVATLSLDLFDNGYKPSRISAMSSFNSCQHPWRVISSHRVLVDIHFQEDNCIKLFAKLPEVGSNHLAWATPYRAEVHDNLRRYQMIRSSYRNSPLRPDTYRFPGSLRSIKLVVPLLLGANFDNFATTHLLASGHVRGRSKSFP
jgi:hypothetical protein